MLTQVTFFMKNNFINEIVQCQCFVFLWISLLSGLMEFSYLFSYTCFCIQSDVSGGLLRTPLILK